MKIIKLLLATSLLFSACNDKPADKKENVKEDKAKTIVPSDTTKTPMPGSDRDEHGCIGSAGYRWSVVKNECIRIWEAGTRLDAAEAVTDKTTSVFAVFSSDNKKVEIYIPHQGTFSIILEQSKNDIKKWVGEYWSLEKISGGLVLKKGGIIQYAE
mgnify:CR=1 FL=1